jgi:hypothetical protein
MQTTDQFFDGVKEMLVDSKDAERQQRRDERLTKCMKVIVIAEKESGGRKLTWWRCKDPRCDFCNSLRGQALMERIEGVVTRNMPVYFAKLPRVAATALCKVIGADNYIRIPQPTDEDIIFYTTQRYTTGDLVTQEFIAEYDWKSTATKRTSRIMSGGLGKSEPLKKPFGPFSIEVQDIVAGPKDIVDQAFAKTLNEVVIWIQPENLADHQQKRNYVNGVIVKNIIAFGGEIVTVLKRRTRTRSLNINLYDIERDFENPLDQEND